MCGGLWGMSDRQVQSEIERLRDENKAQAKLLASFERSLTCEECGFDYWELWSDPRIGDEHPRWVCGGCLQAMLVQILEALEMQP